MITLSTTDNSHRASSSLKAFPARTLAATVALTIATSTAVTATPMQKLAHDAVVSYTIGQHGTASFLGVCGNEQSAALSELAASLQRLSEIAALEYDWNGNGAEKIPMGILEDAKTLVARLPVQPDIFPTARNSLQLEYENDFEDYLEFEIFSGGRIKMFTLDRFDVSETKELTADEVVDAVRGFCGKSI